MKDSGCLLKPFLSDEILQGHVNNNLAGHGRNMQAGNTSVIISSSDTPTNSSGYLLLSSSQDKATQQKKQQIMQRVIHH